MRYEEALRVATAAARRAGAILRKELYRPGGPRGHCGKCEADAAAEREIREALSAHFPDHGIVGEELPGDRGAADADRHVWLVDPNDGTRAYLGGWQGAEVSIALLRAGVPVLGVVFAYAARAGRGDLFCWAEGGPLTRNGRARKPLSACRLDPRCTVLVSQHADENPDDNARLCAPARYRA